MFVCMANRTSKANDNAEIFTNEIIGCEVCFEICEKSGDTKMKRS